jgi:hypothetical protein
MTQVAQQRTTEAMPGPLGSAEHQLIAICPD